MYGPVPYQPGNVLYPSALPPQIIPIKQKDLLSSSFPINYFSVGPSYSNNGSDIPG